MSIEKRALPRHFRGSNRGLMKLSAIVFCLAMSISAIPARADVFLGAIGIEPDTPITGEEDIVIYDLTGPSFGCSTLDGTPICTPVTLDDVVLTINGTPLDLGDVGPGETETYPLLGGVFPDGAITSLSLSADLSATTLIDDLANTYHVDSSISLTGLPTDGSLAYIEGTPVTTATPEPNTLPALVPLFFLFGFALIIRRRKANQKA
jgi:hypothetical protein